MAGVKESIEKAVQYLSENPAKARSTDSLATARLGEALRVEVEGPNGERTVTDMVGGVGGQGEHPSPGWLFRAAIASCVASTIGMEAARQGLELAELEVDVDSESDDRGILGMDESVPAGPLSTRVQVRAKADGVDDGRLREILEAGASRCPVCDATKRAVDVTLEFQTS
ncbi:MAG: OsmC family protein [Actinomycetota bacterium]